MIAIAHAELVAFACVVGFLICDLTYCLPWQVEALIARARYK